MENIKSQIANANNPLIEASNRITRITNRIKMQKAVVGGFVAGIVIGAVVVILTTEEDPLDTE